ncbi:MAG: hypothetical protein WA655_04335 [Candidatus Korobacteraceae bacterium]
MRKSLVVAALLASASFVHAQNAWNFPDFSARQVFLRGKLEISMNVYRAGSRVRVETSPAIATLYEPANNRVYRLSLYPNGRRSCVVMTVAQAQMLPSPLELLFGEKVKRTPVGTDTVDGHACDVEDVEVTTADGKTVKSRAWLAKDLKGVPVKIASQLPDAKLTAFYRDIVIGAPDKALVTPPDQCTPVEKMGQVVEDKTPQ